ncbi:MAG TPA: amino-acid N-acetyltransferase [Gammaproteobacteria bacterium]|nr:amino-acid N-acetyltransferase [Gammaproteobacteria bacterium]
MASKKNKESDFVVAFRQSAPYINAHRGRTFVLAFSGNAVADKNFPLLVHDIALLNSLGVRLVIVHGARPQIEQQLATRKAENQYADGIRITDQAAMDATRDAVGAIRVEIEALFSMGLPNTPMAGARIHLASGNYVTARPYGIRNGVDFGHTGEIRKIDKQSILRNLDAHAVVLLSPLAYSPTGEVFNVNSEEVATFTAAALDADKLIFLLDGRGLRDGRRRIMRQITADDADKMLASRRKLEPELRTHLHSGLKACNEGVERVHLIPDWDQGALLQELFTRDGVGTLISAGEYEVTRQADVDDIHGIAELIAPLEEQGLLVKRSREDLEKCIDKFLVMERDGLVTACAAMITYPNDGLAELASLAVHAEYRNAGRGDALLQHAEQLALTAGIQGLFVLTTQASHWFRERGFDSLDLDKLPVKRRQLYNYRRNSRVYLKSLSVD